MTTITRNDSEQGRSYTIDVPAQSYTFPSVTTVLSALSKPVLVNWAAKMTREGVAELVRNGAEKDDFTDQAKIGALLKSNGLGHNQKRDQASERGTGVHSLLESLCQGLPIIAESGYAKALQAWWDTEKPEVVANEVTVYSIREGFAGTGDLITPTDFLDLKTGSAKRVPYETDYLQTAAYRRAWRQMTGVNLRPGVLICRENGTFDVSYSTDPDADERAFLNLLAVWRWQQGTPIRTQTPITGIPVEQWAQAGITDEKGEK